MENKVKNTSSKARQLLPPGFPRYPASFSVAVHTPGTVCAKELGTPTLFVLLSVQTGPWGEGSSLSSQDQRHPQAGAGSPGLGSSGCPRLWGRSSPERGLPWISRIYWHLLPGSHYPSENNRLCKVTLFRLGFFCVASEV